MEFGTPALAGPYAGLGVAIGSTPEAVLQALQLPNLAWLAVTPAQPFYAGRVRRVVWRPPEQLAFEPVATVASLGAVGWIEQAESAVEYERAIAASHTRRLPVRRGLVCNSWDYGPAGRWRRGWVAMPELYVNVQANLAEAAYIASKYREAGARVIVPWLGAYSSDNSAADAYAKMRGLFPGVCLYAGEDTIAPDVLAVARELP